MWYNGGRKINQGELLSENVQACLALQSKGVEEVYISASFDHEGPKYPVHLALALLGLGSKSSARSGRCLMAKLVTVEFVAENSDSAKGAFQIGTKRPPLVESLESRFWAIFKNACFSQVMALLTFQDEEQMWVRKPGNMFRPSAWTQLA